MKSIIQFIVFTLHEVGLCDSKSRSSRSNHNIQGPKAFELDLQSAMWHSEIILCPLHYAKII